MTELQDEGIRIVDVTVFEAATESCRKGMEADRVLFFFVVCLMANLLRVFVLSLFVSCFPFSFYVPCFRSSFFLSSLPSVLWLGRRSLLYP